MLGERCRVSRQSRFREQATRLLRGPPVSRRALFPWLAVAFGAGAAVYFALPVEPSRALVLALGVSGLLAVGGAIAGPWSLRPAFWTCAALLLGLVLAALRTQAVAAPVLGWRAYGPVMGRIVEIDRSGSDAVRLTLDRVWMADIAPERTPARVRLSLHGPPPVFTPAPGQTVMATAHLSPPEGPVEPGGFDFRRLAWFERLGAVGYTRTPLMLWQDAPPEGLALRLYAARRALSQGLQERIAAPMGGFAAAIVTGDRSGLDADRVEDLRRSNLAHLLAISGLHMGLLTGAVFFALRAALSLVPWLALRLDTRKPAAAGALLAGVLYLGLSGASVATERAFVMAAFMLGALLVDRRALSLRNVAYAALVVVVLRPEAVTQAGFQMSFAATIALVAAFAGLRDAGWHRLPRWSRGSAAVAVSSLVAGAATAPFAAAIFNIWAAYGFLANLAAVPVMGLVVMPGALVAAVLWPLGLEGAGLWAMEQGIAWILGVAHLVAAQPGAVRSVVSPGPWVLPLIIAGGLMLTLGPWRALRAGAVLPLGLALGLWTGATRPEVLISPGGTLVGVASEAGRVLSKPRGDGFAAESWLQNDGDAVPQEVAAARPGVTQSRARSDLDVNGWRIVQVRGKAAAEAARAACTPGVVVVSPERLPGDLGPCTVLDGALFRRAGSVALSRDRDSLRMTAAEGARRPWTARQ
jgi:competence protein ComEC